jgi:hypothetical protein
VLLSSRLGWWRAASGCPAARSARWRRRRRTPRSGWQTHSERKTPLSCESAKTSRPTPRTAAASSGCLPARSLALQSGGALMAARCGLAGGAPGFTSRPETPPARAWLQASGVRLPSSPCVPRDAECCDTILRVPMPRRCSGWVMQREITNEQELLAQFVRALRTKKPVDGRGRYVPFPACDAPRAAPSLAPGPRSHLTVRVPLAGAGTENPGCCLRTSPMRIVPAWRHRCGISAVRWRAAAVHESNRL